MSRALVAAALIVMQSSVGPHGLGAGADRPKAVNQQQKKKEQPPAPMAGELVAVDATPRRSRSRPRRKAK